MKTTVNGKEIKVFGRNDISIVFTQKVNEMLGQGFVFCFESGTQGEEGKVCLTNDGGKTVYILYVHKEYEKIGDKWYEKCDTVSITGEKFMKNHPHQTLWLGKGENFFEKKWFCIDKNKDVYVETIEEFKEIEKISSARSELRWECNEMDKAVILGEKCQKIAVSILNKRDGYKSLKVRHVTKIEKRADGKYYVYFEKSGNKHVVSL